MKAMILAAGLGSRLKPFTDKHPKALAVVNGKTLLQRNIEYLASFGIVDIIVNVHHFADQIVNLLDDSRGFGSNVSISDETDQVLETGGGLKKAQHFLHGSEPFVLMNVDILMDVDLHDFIKYHFENNAIATLAITGRRTTRYLLFGPDNKLVGWRNTKTGEEHISRTVTQFSEKAFSGLHLINSEIFNYITEEGKFSMIDLYLRLSANHDILGYDHSSSKFIDVGKPESIALAEELFR
jgi:N-acetyl-alpha-D-muramate 1-phosphate uridylyltransferase